MAKGKGNGGVQNRAIYSRVSFLQQAAVFLAASSSSSPRPQLQPLHEHEHEHEQEQEHSNSSEAAAATPTLTPRAGTVNTATGGSIRLQGMARRLATDLRSVSLKTRIRLAPAVKQTICKFCDSLLIEGQSCTSTVENRSRGGRKPWADVLVRKCRACERERRYPVHAQRPKRKTERGQPKGEDGSVSKLQKQEG